MKTHTIRKQWMVVVLALFAAGHAAFAGPQSLAGQYNESGRTALVTITDLGGGRYEIKAPRWTGIGFWDEREQCYEGVFRYPETVEPAGHHRIVRVTNDVLAVSWRLSLADNAGSGTYQLIRVKPPKPQQKNP